MKILSEREYDRRIQKARDEERDSVSEKYFRQREEDSLRDAVWREINEMRREMRMRLDAVESAVGLNPTAKDCCPLNVGDSAKPAPFD